MALARVRHAVMTLWIIACAMTMLLPAPGLAAASGTHGRVVTAAPHAVARDAAVVAPSVGDAATGASRSSDASRPRGFLDRMGASLRRETAVQGGGILATEGLRRLAAPFTPVLTRALSTFLPVGLAAPVVKLATEWVSAAAFKVGLDAGESVAGTGDAKARGIDLASAAAAATGMVVGGLLLRPFMGTLGDWVGGWLGWSLAENLLEQHRAGDKFSLTKAFGAIDLPGLMIQMLATEGAALVAPMLMKATLGALIPMSGPLGIVATLGAQLFLTVVANSVATTLYASLTDARTDTRLPSRSSISPVTIRGPGAPESSDPDPLTDSPTAIEREVRDAYSRFLQLTRERGAGDPEALKAFGHYRLARSRLDGALRPHTSANSSH